MVTLLWSQSCEPIQQKASKSNRVSRFTRPPHTFCGICSTKNKKGRSPRDHSNPSCLTIEQSNLQALRSRNAACDSVISILYGCSSSISLFVRSRKKAETAGRLGLGVSWANWTGCFRTEWIYNYRRSTVDIDTLRLMWFSFRFSCWYRARVPLLSHDEVHTNRLGNKKRFLWK